jgi:hypothetical protein
LGHLVSIPVCLSGLPLCFLEPSLLLRLVLLQVRPAPVAASRCLTPLESTPVHSRNCVPVVISEPAFVGPRTGADRQQIFEGNRRGSGSSRLVRCDRASHAGSSCHRWQSGGATSSKRIGSSGPGSEAPECTLSLKATGGNGAARRVSLVTKISTARPETPLLHGLLVYRVLGRFDGFSIRVDVQWQSTIQQ